MSRLDIWKRLLWKEFREDRWPLLMALTAMTALFALARIYVHRPGATGHVLMILASGSVHLALAIWGATKGDSRRGSTQFELTHLPSRPLMGWTATVGVPTLAAAVLGLWYGFLYQSVTERYSPIPMPAIGALDLAITYAVCYFTASLVSLWAGVLVGMAQLVGGALIPVWQSEMPTDAYTVLFATRTLAAALVGALILAWLCRKASPLAQKAAALGAAVLILYGPIVVQGLPDWVSSSSPMQDATPKPTVLSPSDYVSPDMAISVYESHESYRRLQRTWAEKVPVLTKTTDLAAEDLASGLPGRVRRFRRNVEIIGAIRPGRVFLAQQLPESRVIEILEWDFLTKVNAVRVRAKIRTRKQALAERDWNRDNLLSQVREVSPDGRYVLLEIGAAIGSVGEVWAVDLKTGRSNVVSLSGAPVTSTAWTPTRVLVGRYQGAFEVDLRTLRGRPFAIQEAAR